MKTLRRHLVAVVFRHALALVFVAVALLKWSDPAGESTYYGNLGHAAPAVGWAIIVGELLLGGWLIAGVRAGAAAGVALFVVAWFSGAIVVPPAPQGWEWGGTETLNANTGQWTLSNPVPAGPGALSPLDPTNEYPVWSSILQVPSPPN